MTVYSVNEKEEEQIERKRLGNPPEGYSPLEPMEDKLVHIICPTTVPSK